MRERRVLKRAARGLSDGLLENLAHREVIGEDEGGLFLYTISEDAKVYFLELLDLPPEALSKRWQYMELARRFGAGDDGGEG